MASGDVVVNAKCHESEVASYILAYLLQNNFKSTANAFLQECDVLPSKTFIVLPETPLHSVIAEHRARLNAKVLANTLGSEPAWQELWGKLHTTLNQIRCLGEDLNSHRFQPTVKKRVQKVAGESEKNNSLGQSKRLPKPVFVSPRKRKQGSCKRIQHTLSPCASDPVTMDDESARPNSPTLQQVLDTFLDDSFPGKLADIINQCVSSDVCTDDISSDMSSETLERILNVTLSEPTLESKGTTVQSVPSTKLSAIVVPKLTVASAGSEQATLSNSSPDCKRIKVDQNIIGQTDALNFPSEQDIDNFLDQIHH